MKLPRDRNGDIDFLTLTHVNFKLRGDELIRIETRSKMGTFLDNLYAPVALLVLIIYYPIAAIIQVIAEVSSIIYDAGFLKLKFFTSKWKNL